MYVVQKNSFIITTLATFAIITTMTVMAQQEAFGGLWDDIKEGAGDIAESTTGMRSTGDVQEKAGDIAESTTGMRSTHEASEKYGGIGENSFLAKTGGDVLEGTTGMRSTGDVQEEAGDALEGTTGMRSTGDVQEEAGDWSEENLGYRSGGDATRDLADDGKLQKLEQSKAGKTAGDYTEKTYGCRDTQGCIDKYSKFSVPIPFTIPGTGLSGTLKLKGDILNIEDTDIKLTIAGFEPKDFSVDDYTVKGHFEATLEQMLKDLFPGSKLGTNIEKGKQMINDLFRIQINDVAKFKMDVSVKVPIPQSVSDVTQIENIVPIPKLVLQGCYNKISNNLPDVKEVDDLDDFINVDDNPNKVINQEVDDLDDFINVDDNPNKVINQEVDDLVEVDNELSEVINDPNKAINQEYECTELLNI